MGGSSMTEKKDYVLLEDIICIHKYIADKDAIKIVNAEKNIAYPVGHKCHSCEGYETKCQEYQDYLGMVAKMCYKN